MLHVSKKRHTYLPLIALAYILKQNTQFICKCENGIAIKSSMGSLYSLQASILPNLPWGILIHK